MNRFSTLSHRRLQLLEHLESRTLLAGSNDPLLASQYALRQAAVTDAWDRTRGSAAVVVADLDSGADYTHQDLYANIWINQAEIPAPLKGRLRDVDRDGVISFYDLNSRFNSRYVRDLNHNGYIDAGDLLTSTKRGGWEDGVNGQSNVNDRYIDDIIGWDFAEGDNDPLDNGQANGGHGTHTAGILGAMGNNGVGISGVMQKAAIMLVRIFDDAGGSVGAELLARAIRYAADAGARVANASWGGNYGRQGDVLYHAIAYAGSKGQLFVTAAGNDSRNTDSIFVNTFPAEYELDNIIVVGATDQSGSMAYYSNFGSATVDLFAPGSNILSTVPGNGYAMMSGTSMATPMVSGAAALMLSANPELSVAQVKLRLLAGADQSVALNGRAVSDGELNVSNAVIARRGQQLPDTATDVPGIRYIVLLPPRYILLVPMSGDPLAWIV
ncbi:S8 family peptidase [Fontivita pretiosa]|uniref:S8 family peptidase n=1 Tax=Fontivita pretiosa TaxID=2989684 RepID=UPI003D17576D